jgi:hypothetical protein
MHKVWLIFAQCIAALAVVAAALFALDRLIPGLLPFGGGAITIREVASAVAGRMRPPRLPRPPPSPDLLW